MAQNSLYVIGIGGTGAKCLEAILQIASVGLFTDKPIRMLFVDADETNGNLERARIGLKTYQNCYNLLKSQQRPHVWMQTQLNAFSPDLWSPFANTKVNKDLESFFGYNNLLQNDPELASLFDVLYTKDEREANLDVGFRGRPSIGAAIMSRLDLENLDEQPWYDLISQIQADCGSGQRPKIFLCGSIFGGTGASGLPTLGRLIHNKLEGKNIRGSVDIACLFVLPYFQFQPTGPDASQQVYASSDQFLLNTEAALRYYTDQNQYFDKVYLLGDQNFSRYKFSVGKNTQRNEPHFIELYAALAARHFSDDSKAESNNPSSKGTEKVALISRRNPEKLVWGDLPEMADVQRKLATGVRFAYIWLSNILPELSTAQQIGVAKFRAGAPWFDQFFNPELGAIAKIFDKKGQELPSLSDPEEQKAIETVTNWCTDYLRWVREIQEYAPGTIELELFRTGPLESFDGQVRGEYLRDLVLGDTREEGRKNQDEIQKIKEQLINSSTLDLGSSSLGTVRLANALYILSQWS
ncbi:hypothetical protein [Crocosphaera sp. Alani8]|uniref:hypothetical protein n=1 Tax=Crocosphaera sp. Alani8 TaxID=3038952 RepID=UPI00313E4BDD